MIDSESLTLDDLSNEDLAFLFDIKMLNNDQLKELTELMDRIDKDNKSKNDSLS